MEVKVFNKKEDLYNELADFYIKEIQKNPQIVLGLATGSTPIALYQRLIQDHQNNGTSYKSVKTFNLDEYIGLEKAHKESYYSFMHHNLFDHLDIDEKNTNIPDGNKKDAANEYNSLLANKQIDIQLLGVGSNGHIGFNEPSESLDSFRSITHIVKLAPSTREDNKRFFSSLQEVPTHAITMGISNITSAKKIVLVATGSNKKEAITKLLSGQIDPMWPVTALSAHSDVLLFIDKEAKPD